MLKNKNTITIQRIPEVLITLGIFLMLVSGTYWSLRFRALSLDRQILAEYQSNKQPDRLAQPVHIFIEWFVDTPIETHHIYENKWTISDSVASYLEQSARPGEGGNIIVYGHNTRNILGNIRALKGNEKIRITTEDGINHFYQIEHIVEVEPNQTEYLKPTVEETLTLYTCSGFMDRKRFIVQAKPL